MIVPCVVMDGIVITILLVGLLLGIKQGFVRIAFQKLSKAVAVVLAILCAKPFGKLLSDWFMSDAVTNLIVSKLPESARTATNATELLNATPAYLRAIAALFKYDLAASATHAFESDGDALHILISDLSRPLSNGICVLLSAIALFFVALLLLRILRGILEAVADVPGLNVLNCVMGGALSLVFSAITAWCVCRIAGYLTNWQPIAGLSFMQDFSFDSCWIAKYFYRFDLLGFILSVKPTN